MEACQLAVSSREFAEWQAFDRYEPIGSRTVPELLALLAAMQANQWKGKGDRMLLPQDILPDPMAPARLSPAEEGQRTRSLAADYRKLRAERLARDKMDPNDTSEQVH